MPIAANEIKFYLSGGAANSDPNLALGGAISSVEATTTLFDNVSSAEASAGHTDYRCIYVKNTNATITGTSAKVWLFANTPSADTAVTIALAGEGVNGTAETVANENTAPVGETFSAAASEAAALAIGSLAPGAYQAIWIKRVVNASAAAATGDGFTLRAKLDTSA
jgi:hypothetical protein